MLKVLRRWFNSRFHDEEAIILTFILLIGVLLVVFFGQIMTPVIAAVVIAYLLQGVVKQLTAWFVPHIVAVSIATILLLLIEVVFVFFSVTLLLEQLINLVQEMPRFVNLMRDRLEVLQQANSDLIQQRQVEEWIELANNEAANLGQWVVAYTQKNVPNLFSFMVYLVLVPVMVFFMLKDKALILGWFGRLLPDKKPLLNAVWVEMDRQMANYVRGKVIEMFIVGGTSLFVFSFFGLKYAALLAFAVGLSVVVPYVGAFFVTLPVALVAYLQWGWTSDFFWLLGWYLVIQILDGNALVPLLFSEAVNLHPIAILIAIMFFGGIWGLWGVFFAIPLATLISAVLNAWPSVLKST